MKKPIVPPKELKLDLVTEVGELLAKRFPRPTAAITYLLLLFSTFDLVHIRNELRQREKEDAIQSKKDRQRH
jgi:ABC-type Fe3+ transport system permease subunit